MLKLCLVGLLKNLILANLHHASLILDCRTFINQIPQAKIKHCFHKANKCADSLARILLDLNQDFMFFDSSSELMYAIIL